MAARLLKGLEIHKSSEIDKSKLVCKDPEELEDGKEQAMEAAVATLATPVRLPLQRAGCTEQYCYLWTDITAVKACPYAGNKL